ncbi:MAG: hypothetical protein RBR02_09610 [Desulfuromonadaceae bacterium]|nr:hypothetical protein [Desulfuromonadaceae bacterium]
MLPIKKTVKQIEELLVKVSSKTLPKNKKDELETLLLNLKAFLKNTKADENRKAEIILRLPLLALTIRKA